MGTILEINNWNQLVRARSEQENLRILVTRYDGEDLIGTKIQIVDYNTNDIYLTIFANVLYSDLIPVSASMPEEDVVSIINSYGFNIAISQPEVLSQNVVTILRGMYAEGYRYVYKDYVKLVDPVIKNKYVIYVSKEIELRQKGYNITQMPDYIEDEWDWCRAFKTYPIEDLIENGTVDNGVE